MNTKRKEAAVKTHLDNFNKASGPDEVVAALKADAKNYTDAEISEIMEALPGESVNKEQTKGGLLKTYEYWKVRPIYEAGQVVDWKTLEELISTTTMEPRFAEALNNQSHNSGFRYFEVAE